MASAGRPGVDGKLELGPCPGLRAMQCRRSEQPTLPWHAWPAHWINRHVALSSSAMVHKPLGLLAELTHRCPLGCPYCSNPLALDAREDELDTATWGRVFGEAAGLGVLQ